MGAPGLPNFPCWCRATYSWGGETKKDLGFVEGDLIEALNAGDGQWWMGRLRRDPRAIGLFPSNFVSVLDQSFQPAPNSRNASPRTQTPPKQAQRGSVKSGVFRKPFQAYEEVSKRSSLESSNVREGTPESDRERRKSKFRPYSSMKTAQAPTRAWSKQNGDGHGGAANPEAPAFRVPSPPPRGGSREVSPMPATTPVAGPPTPTSGYAPPSRTSTHQTTSPQPSYHPLSHVPYRPHSPLPSTYHDGSAYPQLLPSSRQPSPKPYQQQRQPHFRAASPAPSYGYPHSRPPSPSPLPSDDDVCSSPPPPPPAHRVAYQPSRPPSPQQEVEMAGTHYETSDEYGGNGRRTPMPPPSPGSGNNMTPSPLRDAMNDVMSSLHDMSSLQQREPRTEGATEIWSPDAYELVRSQSRQEHRARSSLGFRAQSQYGPYDGDDTTTSLPLPRNGPPRLNDYVQRMDSQLRHAEFTASHSFDHPPTLPLKGSQFSTSRPQTSGSSSSQESHKAFSSQSRQQQLRHRKSAYELGRDALSRTYTTRTNATNSTAASSATQSSTSTQLTGHSIMSGHSAGGFSATSAGSLARRKLGLGSQRGKKTMSMIDTQSAPDINSRIRSMAMSDVSGSGSGPSYHESHGSGPGELPAGGLALENQWVRDQTEASNSVFGGLNAPRARKSGFFRKMIDNAKSTARTGAATARSTMGSRPSSRSGPSSPTKSLTGGGGLGIPGGLTSRPGSAAGGAASDMGFGGGAASDWMQVRRDINRSNSLSQRERDERAERCEMLDFPVLNPIDHLLELAEGDEGLDGLPVPDPTDFNNMPNLALVDKSTRFIQSVPAMINAAALAQSYVCRPHRSDVQRLRAIFTWVAECVAWEEDFEGPVDTRRVVQTKRGCSEEIALLVRDMCSAVGLQAEIVRGYLKAPGEVVNLDTLAQPNHWWNAVIVDGEWRIMDCSLAGSTNPKRSAYSSASSQAAESWYFLARPLEICYTHVPILPEQQHIVPPVPHEVLANLPCACPTYFQNAAEVTGFDTSLLYLEGLEMSHLRINVPEDVECVAEVEARAFVQDADGDLFESGDVVKKKALAQPQWVGGRKQYTIKALLPGDEGQGVLKVYAGKRGLMHSIKDNPHPLAVALPLSHVGQNPPYDFLIRHPTPHAQRHDLYVAQPQCRKLVMNNTFVFCVRQHPSSLHRFTPDTWGSAGLSARLTSRPSSPNPYPRPTSAMSSISTSVSQSGSAYSDNSSNQGHALGSTASSQKPAKLAIQTPSQKIIRLTRKQEHSARTNDEDQGLASGWETIIKIGEKGIWRGLVLADRSARWCVFAEWECV